MKEGKEDLASQGVGDAKIGEPSTNQRVTSWMILNSKAETEMLHQKLE